jgi:5-methylcytosine-specific restriction endonuclease McrA
VAHALKQLPLISATGRCELEDGNPLDVGRLTRSIPPALRRALNSRDRGCCFPGCDQTRYVDGHHIRHWAKGGATSLANLVSLCRFHHRQVHDGGDALGR